MNEFKTYYIPPLKQVVYNLQQMGYSCIERRGEFDIFRPGSDVIWILSPNYGHKWGQTVELRPITATEKRVASHHTHIDRTGRKLYHEKWFEPVISLEEDLFEI